MPFSTTTMNRFDFNEKKPHAFGNTLVFQIVLKIICNPNNLITFNNTRKKLKIRLLNFLNFRSTIHLGSSGWLNFI